MQEQDFLLGKRIGIIAKDAGAANLICHYFKNKKEVIVFSEKPATKIFSEFDPSYLRQCSAARTLALQQAWYSSENNYLY